MATEQPLPAAPRRRGGSVPDLLRSLAVIGAVVAVIVLLVARPSPEDEVRTVDYTSALQQARDAAPFPVLAPAGLGDGWRATSARTSADEGAVAWHLGFVTPEDRYAAVEQSASPRAKVLREFVEGSRAAGSVSIGGRTWERREGGQPHPRALVTAVGGATTLVVGDTSRAELEQLAAALQPG